jgi:hypothetical protein
MRDLEGFSKFIGDQLFSSLDDFIQRNRDELFLMKGDRENTNVCLSIQLEDDQMQTKMENTDASAQWDSNLFYHLLRTYCWTYCGKNKVDDDLEEVGMGNLKQFLKRNEIFEPGCLIAQRVKTQYRYRFLTEDSNGKNKDKEELNHSALEELARKVIQDWGGIRFKDGTSYYDRVSSDDFEKDSEIIASRSKFYAHTQPEGKYIYDSRVSMALLIFANLWENEDPDYFPLVEGRSNGYKRFKEIFENERKLSLKNSKEFYDDYCKVISTASNQLIDKLAVGGKLEEKELKLFGQLVEMALFSFGRKIKEVEKKNFDSFFRAPITKD